MSVVRKSLLTVCGTVVLGVANLGIGVILARWLSPSGLGQYALLTSTATLLGILGSLGLGGASIYFINSLGIEKRLVTTVVLRTALTVAVALAVVATIALRWEPYFGVLPATAAGAVSLLVLGKVVLPSALLLLMAAMKVLKYVMIQVMPSLVLLTLIAVLALGDQLTIGPALWSAAVGQVLAVVVLVWFLRADFDWRRRFCWSELSPLLGYGVLINLAHFAYNAGMEGGLFLLRALAPEFDEVGFYQAALRLGSVVVMMVMSVGPLLFSKYASSDEVSRPRQVERTSRVFWVAVFAIVVVMEGAARPIVLLLFGPEFEPAVPVLQVLLLGMAARALVTPMLQMFYSVGAPGWVLAILGVNVLVMVALMGLLIPSRAAVGAALSFVLANVVALIAGYALARMRYGVHLRNCFLIRRSDVRYLVTNLRMGVVNEH